MKRILTVLLMVGLLLVGCSSTETSDEHTPDTPSSGGSSDTAEEEKPIGPLTGLAMEGDPNHPVVMVIMNNHPDARPQTGLNRADIVFELLAEGEVTRFAAFYHSETVGNVGPVRSARPYYLDLAEGFDAVVAHAGGSPDAKERFTQPGYPSLDGIAQGEKYFTRVDFRQAPHNLYTSMEQLLQGAEERGFADQLNFPQLLFSDVADEVVGVEEAKNIHIVYSSLYEIGYTYDSGTEQYTRLTEGERQVDRETEEPLTMNNVLVIKAPHRVLDDEGRREIGFNGSGEGWLFQKGEVREIQWRYEDGFTRPYADGQPLPLVPGKTWVNVIPEDAEVNYGEQQE